MELLPDALVPSFMGNNPKPEPREIFLGAWLELFEIGSTDAAAIAKCSQSYISNISRGRKGNINALYLMALSEEMGITVNDLFRRPPPRTQIAQLREYSPQARAALITLKRKRA